MMRIGIICPAEIAIRRFLPALTKIKDIEFCGVAINSVEERYGNSVPSKSEVLKMLDNGRQKADKIIEEYGGRIYDSYYSMVSSPDLDAIYIPLPPALHYTWAKMALENGKHVLVEKPATTSLSNTCDLIDVAQKAGVGLHENYMFVFHKQLEEISRLVSENKIGEVRLYRITFGFPRRDANDFRYSKELGGGALYDAGGYTIKYASLLLGKNARIVSAYLNKPEKEEVDLYGSGTMVNDYGTTVQVAFGMDNDYRCELEVWGSKGTLRTGRILTAPNNYTPSVEISINGEKQIVELSRDDTFVKSIEYFKKCVVDNKTRCDSYDSIRFQAELVESFFKMASIR